MTPPILSGRVRTGQGRGADFTNLAWARQQFLTQLGIDPHPGTLNLHLDQPADQDVWASLKKSSDLLIIPPDPAWCQARAYPVRVAGQVPGAIILPELPGYPETQVEVIAALPLRQTLQLVDGNLLSLHLNQPLLARAVIFDVDGTLVDSLNAYHRLAELAAAPHRIPIDLAVVRFALNNSDVNFWELVVSADRPDRLDVMAAMKAEAMRCWPDVLAAHGRVLPGLGETLTRLKSAGLRLGIVTASHSGSFQPLREAGLLDVFEAIVTGADVTRRKPDPEGLLKCAAALGVEPGEAVYVGDTPIDVQASRAAGLGAVAVLSGAGDSALLSAAGPDWLIHSHARLPEIILP